MKTVIVTGASSGIGREFALETDKKYSPECMWLISRRGERMEETAKLINAKTEIIPTDLALPKSLEMIKNKLQKDKPQIQLLINAAGFGKFGNTQSISDEDTENMINVNIRALTMISKLCIPYIAEGGHIINMASASAFVSLPYMNIYAATKAYVLHFSQALANELSDKNIGVTAVCPHWVTSEFIPTAQDSPDGNAVNNFMFMTYPFNVVNKALKDSDCGKKEALIGVVPKVIKFLSKILSSDTAHLIWNNSRKFTARNNQQYLGRLPLQELSDLVNS